jgi:D-glycero-D-manno-heptose 1,7-bisphosphate phosphatase
MSTKQAVILFGNGETERAGPGRPASPLSTPLGAEAGFFDETLFGVARQGYDDVLLLSDDDGLAQRYDGKTICGARLRVVRRAGTQDAVGALRDARDLLDPTFLLIAGDLAFDVNFRRLEPVLNRDESALAALALRPAPEGRRDGAVDFAQGRILGWREGGGVAAGDAALVSMGVGRLRRDALADLESGPETGETRMFARLAADGKLLGEVFDAPSPIVGQDHSPMRSGKKSLRLRPRPALFLDRDGVLNRDGGYTHRTEDLKWISGAIEVVRRANDMGALVIVVTNQAGIAYGYYAEAEVERFHAAMREELHAAGAFIDAFYHCPHHPDATVERWRHPDPPDRKPNPGMILRALAEWPIDVSNSFMIGDRESDVEAGARAGLRSLLFIGEDLRVAAEPAFAAMADAVARRPLAGPQAE